MFRYGMVSLFLLWNLSIHAAIYDFSLTLGVCVFQSRVDFLHYYSEVSQCSLLLFLIRLQCAGSFGLAY